MMHAYPASRCPQRLEFGSSAQARTKPISGIHVNPPAPRTYPAAPAGAPSSRGIAHRDDGPCACYAHAPQSNWRRKILPAGCMHFLGRNDRDGGCHEDAEVWEWRRLVGSPIPATSASHDMTCCGQMRRRGTCSVPFGSVPSSCCAVPLVLEDRRGRHHRDRCPEF